jgi:hypothetical protein
MAAQKIIIRVVRDSKYNYSIHMHMHGQSNRRFRLSVGLIVSTKSIANCGNRGILVR